MKKIIQDRTRNRLEESITKNGKRKMISIDRDSDSDNENKKIKIDQKFVIKLKKENIFYFNFILNI